MTPTTTRDSLETPEIRIQHRRSLHDTFCSILERAVATLRHKPQSIYDLRSRGVRSFFERHVADYRRWITEGADVASLLDGHEVVGLEIERAGDLSSIPGRLNLTLDEALQHEVDAEGVANPIQLRGARSQTLADVQAALDVSYTELRTLKQYIRALERRRDALVALGRHVGFHRSLGAAQ